MITTTSISPLTSIATSNASVTSSVSPRESAALTSAPSAAASRADTPAAVFIRSERYQALEHARPVAPATSAGAAETVSKPGVVRPLPGAEERSQQTAANILGFMTLQLQRDVQDGAGAEALSSRVLAGLEGFKQGFTEAAQQLSDMGLMTAELKAELLLTYDQVIAGAEALHQQFVGTGLEQDAPADPFAALSTATAATTYQTNPSLQTSLDDFSTYVTEQLLGQRQGVDSLLAYLETLQIEAEPVMVSQLLEKVTELAESYTSGGVQAAYEAAVELGYSDQKIGLYVQQLGQPSVQRAQQAYGNVQSQDTVGESAGRWQPLVNFAQNLRDVHDSASRLPQTEDVLVRMTEVVNTSSEPGFQRVTAVLLSAQRDTD